FFPIRRPPPSTLFPYTTLFRSLSAYQSYLWNKMLARWLQRLCRPDQLISISLRLGEMPMHRHLDESQRSVMARTTLPLPSARLKDRKSTRLNSSHVAISYAVFC